MFDLEQSIADWRKQMLAAGIKAPVPLEELEIHLREEIKRQTGTGLSETEAFKTSVQKIGPDRLFKTNSRKSKPSKKIASGNRWKSRSWLLPAWFRYYWPVLDFPNTAFLGK